MASVPVLEQPSRSSQPEKQQTIYGARPFKIIIDVLVHWVTYGNIEIVNIMCIITDVSYVMLSLRLSLGRTWGLGIGRVHTYRVSAIRPLTIFPESELPYGAHHTATRYMCVCAVCAM